MWKIRKRGQTYQIDVNVDGQRVRRSAGTSDKKQAEKVARKIEEELISQLKLGEKPTHLWQHAVVRFAKETNRKSFQVNDIPRLRLLAPYFNDKPLEDITSPLIWDAIEELADERDYSNSTQNKIMGMVRAILYSAKRWDWLPNPPQLRAKAEPKKRVRWITEIEVHRLITSLPEGHKNPVRFALATGLRKSNIYDLTWEQVDLQRKVAWIYGDQAKAGKDIRIPLNSSAIDILREQLGKHPTKVFEMCQINSNSWKRSCQKASIEAFRFHDLRHTWASWHVMNGTSLQELMELGGWSDYSMVLKYAHLSHGHLAEAAERVTNLEQEKKTGPKGIIRKA